MADHEPKFGEHSRDQEQPRNEKHKETPFTYDLEEVVEILLQHIKKCHKDKKI